MRKKILKTMGIITLLYSLCIFSGGVTGFLMSNSIPSLVAGFFFGLALLLTSVKILANQLSGVVIALSLMLLLEAFFCYRLFITEQFFPAGGVVIITTCAIAAQIYQLLRLKNSSLSN